MSPEQTFLQAKAAYSEASLRQDLARQKLSALELNAAEVARLAKQDEGTPNASTLREYELRAPRRRSRRSILKSRSPTRSS